MKKIMITLLLGAAILAAWIWIRSSRAEVGTIVQTPLAATTSSAPNKRNQTDSNAVIGTKNIEIKSQDFSKDYEYLKANAERDAAYAYAFALELLECEKLESSYEAVADVNALSKISKDTTRAMLESVEKNDKKCNGLSAEKIALYSDLVDFAARSGVIEAQLNYSTILAGTINAKDAIESPEKIIEYKKKSVDYLNRAAVAGDSRALLHLGLAYDDGILVKKDPETAYKYLYAYSLSSPNARVHSLLSQVESQLTISQIGSSQKEGSLLYSSCCR